FLAALRRPGAASPATSAIPAGATQPGPEPLAPGAPHLSGPAVGNSRSAWPAVLSVAGLAAITVLALGLQIFTFPFLAGDQDSTIVRIVRNGLQVLAGGPAAADASLLLIVLMLLGVGAWLLVVLTGLRIEIDPARPGPAPARRGRAGALVATCLGALAVLAITGYGLWPLLIRLGSAGPQVAPRTGEVLVNTWGYTLISTVIGVGLATVAGFGIGWLRPLGRWSELLLLPFAPWLFIAVGPLVLAKFEKYIMEITWYFGMTPIVIIPPIGLVIPALFILTLLFRGLAHRQSMAVGTGAVDGAGSALLRALPMVGLLAGATWLVQAESPLWPLVASFRETTAVSLAYQMLGQYATRDLGIALLLPIPVILVFGVALGVLQVFYLDRLAIRVGHQPRGQSPR